MKRTYDAHYKSNRKIHDLDVSFISSSRPDLLAKTIRSWRKCIFTYTRYNGIIHEDVLDIKKSEKVLDLMDAWNFNKSKRFVSNPPIGPSRVIDFLQNKWETEYVFHMQDDWEFELPVDLDRILWTMENHKNIKCIFFNKRGNDKIGDIFEPTEVDYDGLRLCTSYYWPFLPGIWRISEFRRNWRSDFDKPEANFNDQMGELDKKIKLANLDKLGIYSLGHKNHPRYVRHLGENESTLPWKVRPWKKDNKTKYSVSDIRYRAPWLPQVEELP